MALVKICRVFWWEVVRVALAGVFGGGKKREVWVGELCGSGGIFLEAERQTGSLERWKFYCLAPSICKMWGAKFSFLAEQYQEAGAGAPNYQSP